MAKRSMSAGLRAGMAAEKKKPTPKKSKLAASEPDICKHVALSMPASDAQRLEEFVVQCVVESGMRHSRSSVVSAAIKALMEMPAAQRRAVLQENPPLPRGAAAHTRR